MRKIKIVPSLLSSFLVADCNWFTIEWKILIKCWLEATCRCSRCCFPWPWWVFHQWTCWDKFGPITSASKVFLKYFCVEQNLSQLNFADSCQMILTSSYPKWFNDNGVHFTFHLQKSEKVSLFTRWHFK